MKAVQPHRPSASAKAGTGVRWRAVGCALIAVLAAAACQGKEAGSAVAGAKAGAAATAGASASPAPAPAVSAPVPGPGTALEPPSDDGAALLAARPLIVPVAGIAPADLMDTFEEKRPGQRSHEAIDIVAPRGTPVYAVDDGTLAKLFTSVPGGLTLYQFDPEGNLAYYYAHLDRYAPGLKEGMTLRRGDLIGYVGSTGNASPATPHLHFAVFRLGPQRHWWQGQAVNPYPALRRARPAG